MTDADPRTDTLTDDERRCARHACKSIIDLWRGYLKLNAEDKKMKIKQKRLSRDIIHLQLAWAKLK